MARSHRWRVPERAGPVGPPHWAQFYPNGEKIGLFPAAAHPQASPVPHLIQSSQLPGLKACAELSTDQCSRTLGTGLFDRSLEGR